MAVPQTPQQQQKPKKLTKWEKLYLWVAKRHDYLEREYKETNVAADGLELGVFRKMYEAMNSFQEQEDAERRAEEKANPPTQASRSPGVR